jgi:hypothetical protein
VFFEGMIAKEERYYWKKIQKSDLGTRGKPKWANISPRTLRVWQKEVS